MTSTSTSTGGVEPGMLEIDTTTGSISGFEMKINRQLYHMYGNEIGDHYLGMLLLLSIFQQKEL